MTSEIFLSEPTAETNARVPGQADASVAPTPAGDEGVEARLRPVWNVPAAVAGWVLPGLGHLLAGHISRGLVLMVCIGGMWVSGLLIGGVSVVEYRGPNGVRPWFLGQALIAPSFAVQHLHHRYRAANDGRSPEPDDLSIPYQPAYAQAYELGTLTTALAGLLNFLAIIDIVYREPRRSERRPTHGAKA